MIHDGKVLGLPLVDYSNTKAAVEALSGCEEGMTAYATDDDQIGYYDGSDWQWFAAPGGSSVVEVDIDFTASASEDETVAIGSAMREVLRGRLYIDTDPGAAFSAWATFTFYNKAAMHGADAFYRTEAKLVYTELEVATTGTDANITPDDHTDFSPNDLAYILDVGDEEFIRLATIADTMVAEDTIAAHAINDGLVRVVEFSGFSLFNYEAGTDVYLRVEFASAQTVSLKMQLVLKE